MHAFYALRAGLPSGAYFAISSKPSKPAGKTQAKQRLGRDFRNRFNKTANPERSRAVVNSQFAGVPIVQETLTEVCFANGVYWSVLAKKERSQYANSMLLTGTAKSSDSFVKAQETAWHGRDWAVRMTG